jgi:hypothetical protein
MINSREPWSVKSFADKTAQLRDADGNCIGIFTDYQNAEYIVSFIEGRDEKIVELETECDELEKGNNKLDEENLSLKDKLEKSEAAPTDLTAFGQAATSLLT